MMRALRKISAVAFAACVLVSGAQGAAFDQRKGEEKRDPPKQEKVIPKEEKQPKSNDQPRNNDQNRGRNDNRKPPLV